MCVGKRVPQRGREGRSLCPPPLAQKWGGMSHEWPRFVPHEGGFELPGTGADLGHSVIHQTSWHNHSLLMAGVKMLPIM